VNKTDKKEETSSFVPGRQSRLYKPCLCGTWACVGISVILVGVILCLAWVRISWNIPEDLNKFIGKGLFPISSLAGLSVTCLTAFLAVLIYLRQRQHAVGIYKQQADDTRNLERRLRYGDEIGLEKLPLLLDEWIGEKKANCVICLSNYSQIPGFWLCANSAAKIIGSLKICNDSKNKVKILLFGPNADKFKEICNQVVPGSERWGQKTPEEVFQQYNSERDALDLLDNISFGFLREDNKMPVNVLILADTSDQEIGKFSGEVVYGYEHRTTAEISMNYLAKLDLRHATDEGLYQIIYSLARALTPEKVWREVLQK
jgi:hypothetical protein